MWYLILCFALLLFLSKDNLSNKTLSVCFLGYLLRLDLTSTLTLNEYLWWTISLLHLFWFYTYLNFKKVYLIDTIIVSCIKLVELLIITFPFVSFYLPDVVSVNLFRLDNIFLSGVITCLVLRETGYSVKVNTNDWRKLYLLSGVVMLHIIAYVF